MTKTNAPVPAVAYEPHPAVTVHSDIFAAEQAMAARPSGPRNVLEAAAEFNQREDAIVYLCRIMGFKSKRLAYEVLPEDYRWAKFSVPARLAAISDWVRAEAFDLMDLVSCPEEGF